MGIFFLYLKNKVKVVKIVIKWRKVWEGMLVDNIDKIYCEFEKLFVSCYFWGILNREERFFLVFLKDYYGKCK